ncbi:hypothetical protein MPNT_510013 [Candidatus Methylacidithermus pantelleriae]|uniref:Uncharacterized protein n=1 Tax=Candidatus Methylacidithermus pantelleriae TaxID=2744239 RepID=A0A8J2FX49_9BACT|nr:hypothetical protein MPNT_510013 [Candidatus Methylacidithermus pantelleriae]
MWLPLFCVWRVKHAWARVTGDRFYAGLATGTYPAGWGRDWAGSGGPWVSLAVVWGMG